MKLRLDKTLLERKLAPTRARAQERIAAGQVRVDGVRITRASFLVEPRQAVETEGEDLPYVSRGGLKLAAALDAWKLDLTGRTCLDIGISTGGFSDCMLQRGAALVIGIDCGHGQLASSLRNHPRLRLLERTNARSLTADMLSSNSSAGLPLPIGFFAVDVSFIAASLVLPAVIASAFPGGAAVPARTAREAVVLVKPQFEAGREFVGRHGIVRSAVAHRQSRLRVRDTLVAHGARQVDEMDSPIAGGDGNREFLLYARF